MYEITAQPTAEPLTLTEVKNHLRVEGTAEDDLITQYMKSARETIEKHTNRALMTQTIKQYFDCFNGTTLETRFAPIQSLTHVKYYNSDNDLITLTKDTDYYEDLKSEPARIVAINSWPTTKDRPNTVEIQYVAGYADAASVPANIKQAILLLVGEMYEQRENSVKRLPDTVSHLLSPCKVIV